MMNIGFLFKDNHLPNVGYKHPECGNPGTGGTQFCFLMLMWYLAQQCSNINVYCFYSLPQHFPDGVIGIEIQNDYDIFSYDLSSIDIMIFRCNGGDLEWYKKIKELKTKFIAWAHNDLSAAEIRLLEQCDSVRRVVCVGRQQYDRLVDTSIFHKTTYIYNMFENDRVEYQRRVSMPIVTYVGSMVEAKSFHILAMQWKKIIKAVPDAQLYVIGSSKTYNDLHNEGISDYERYCMSFLMNKNGDVMSSVHLCGNLGISKLCIYQKTKVGVVNPTANTETFCLGAVELQACGIPVVSCGKGGLLDTVVNKETGLMYRNVRNLHRDIVRLLMDNKLNDEMGHKAKIYVHKFSPEIIGPCWVKMFEDVEKDLPNKNHNVNNHYFSNLKWLRMINKTSISIIQIGDMLRRLRAHIR